MKWRVLGCLFGLAGASCSGLVSEMTEVEGGDAGPLAVTDAGSGVVDAGAFDPRVDSGVGAGPEDAGVTPPADAGLGPDAGWPLDAGTSRDAGTAHDAGALPPFDAGALPPVADGGGPYAGQRPTVLMAPQPLTPTNASLFDDTCGVVWNPVAGELLLTVCQINNVWRWRPGVTANNGFDIVRTGGEGVYGMNGLAVMTDGSLLVAEAQVHRLTRSTKGYDQPVPLVESWSGDATTPAGSFNMPLHVVSRADGTIYFTDPYTESGGHQVSYTAVYRLAPDGSLSLHFKNLRARGLALTADQRTLYLSGENNYGQTQLYRVALNDDGSPGPAVLFADAPGAGNGAYGLCVDQAGNLYHAGLYGVRVHLPSGALIDTLDVPGSNDCAFGEADAQTLFFTTGSSLATHNLYRARVSIPGVY